MRRLRARTLLLLVLACAAPLAAKEPTRKLVISGGHLAGIVEITDSATLALSDVYTGGFLAPTGGAVRDVSGLPEYDLAFYLDDHRRPPLLRLFARPHLYRAYVVRLALDTVTHEGWVYLPGGDDLWASWNHGVIIRRDREHRWNRTSAEWTRRIAGVLATARHVTPTCPRPDAFGLLHERDAVYRDAEELRRTLDALAIHVLCTTHSTFDGTLGRPAAGVVTTLGPLAALVFPSDSAARTVKISGSVRDGIAETVLRAPGPPRASTTFGSAEPSSFVVIGRFLIDTFGQRDLERMLRARLR